MTHYVQALLNLDFLSKDASGVRGFSNKDLGSLALQLLTGV